MGISDTGGSGEQTYSTDRFLGVATITSLTTYNSSLGADAGNASVQLNAFVRFDQNGTGYDYWVQDVLELDTSTHRANFEDNVWNASSPGNSSLDAGKISGSGSIATTPEGAYYADVAPPTFAGAGIVLSYPATVRLELNASTDTLGRPQVNFSFDDGLGWQTYDTVTFRFAPSVTDLAGFSVAGGDLGAGCPRCRDNAELVLGGPYGGFDTTVGTPSHLELQLSEWTGTNFAAVPDADNQGSATAEGATGASVGLSASSGGAPAAVVVPGTFASGALWRASDLAQLLVSVGIAAAAGTASVGPDSTAFVNGSFELRLLPGTYTVHVVAGTGSYFLTNLGLSAGEVLTEEVGAIPVTFYPLGLPPSLLWSITLGARTLRGTGTITFGVANGSYNFTVGDVGGYTASPTSGNVSIAGAGWNQTIGWTPNGPGIWEQLRTLLEQPLGPVPLWIILLGLFVLGVVSAALGSTRRRRRRPRRLDPTPAPDETFWDGPG